MGEDWDLLTAMIRGRVPVKFTEPKPPEPEPEADEGDDDEVVWVPSKESW